MENLRYVHVCKSLDMPESITRMGDPIVSCTYDFYIQMSYAYGGSSMIESVNMMLLCIIS